MNPAGASSSSGFQRETILPLANEESILAANKDNDDLFEVEAID